MIIIIIIIIIIIFSYWCVKHVGLLDGLLGVAGIIDS